MWLFVYCIPLLVTYVASAPPWASLSKNSPYSQKEGLRKSIQSFLRNPEIETAIGKSLFQSVDVKSETNGCDCVKYNCGCCVHMEVYKIDLNSTACANITYLPGPVYGISATLTIGDRTIINETISAKDPPPICVNVPYLKEFASVCLRFYNMTVSYSFLSGCVKLEARAAEIPVADVKIGCFTIPPNHEDQWRQLKTVRHLGNQGSESSSKYLTFHHDRVLEKSVNVVPGNDGSVRVVQRLHRN